MRVSSRNQAAVAVGLAVVAIIGACHPGTPVPIGPSGPPSENVIVDATVLANQDSVCNKNDAQLALDRGLDSNATNFARANGYYNWCIPEYDDDQRFSDGGGPHEYGPIAHVLAAPWLQGLSFTPTYVQVAIIEVDPDPNHPRPAPYNQLRLAGQFNCLYLRSAAAQPGRASPSFDALILPPPASLKCPIAPVDQPGPPLIVFVDQQLPVDSTEIPATTRFVEGRDGENRRTLIGVKCGNHWCVVGPPGTGSPMPPSAHAGVSPLLSNVQGRVKGWFDDQVLGVPDNASTFKISRRFRASAVPDPNLGGLKVAQFLVDSGLQVYQTVGRVYFDSMPNPESKYAQMFHFISGINIIGLRAEIWHVGNDQKTVWFTQVRNDKGVKNDIPTQRMDHSKYLLKLFGDKAQIPATMRWRWFDQDEDLWVECDLGCCLAGKGT